MWRSLALGTAVLAAALAISAEGTGTDMRVNLEREYREMRAQDCERQALDQSARTACNRDDRLRWAPPPVVNPIVVHVPTSYYGATFPSDRDVLLLMPHEVRWSTINITGGHNVRLIGGATVLNTDNGATGVIRFSGQSGSVFIEGTEIDVNGRSDDGIDVAGSPAPPYTLFPDVYIENCRITGLDGTFHTNHADVIQTQGSIGRLFIDKLTGQSNYQGIFIPPQFPIKSAHISRVNLSYAPGGQRWTYLLWLLDPQTNEAPYPVDLSDVWIKPRPGQDVAANAVAPWAGAINSDRLPIGAIARGGGHVTWPRSNRVSGYVSSGVPSGGDFVPAGSVGLGYVSPGYASTR
jgi:hypothetical protein